MSETAESVTAAEAAAIAAVSVSDVYRVFNEDILPSGVVRRDGEGPRLLRGALPLLALYFRTADVLAAEARRSLVADLVGEGGGGLSVRAQWDRWAERAREVRVGSHVSVQLAPFITAVSQRADALTRARAMIVSDPDILGGTPVFRGTRIPVYDIAGMLSGGTPREQILIGYPALTDEALTLADLYARAEPQRGRPTMAERRPPGARLRSSRRAVGAGAADA